MSHENSERDYKDPLRRYNPATSVILAGYRQDFRSIRSRFLYSALPRLNLSPQRMAQNFLNGLIIFRGMMEKTPDSFIHV